MSMVDQYEMLSPMTPILFCSIIKVFFVDGPFLRWFFGQHSISILPVRGIANA